MESEDEHFTLLHNLGKLTHSYHEYIYILYAYNTGDTVGSPVLWNSHASVIKEP